MARKSIAKKIIDVDAGTTTWQFHDSDNTEVVYDSSKAPGEMRTHLELHGAAQKGGDDYGKADSIEEAIAICREAVQRMYDGEWKKVTAGGGTGTKPSMVLQAVITALENAGETVDDERTAAIKATLATADNRKAALAIPEVKVEYTTLQEAAIAARKAAAQEAVDAAEGDSGLAMFS